MTLPERLAPELVRNMARVLRKSKTSALVTGSLGEIAHSEQRKANLREINAGFLCFCREASSTRTSTA